MYLHLLISPETVQGKLLVKRPRGHSCLFLIISAFVSRPFDVLYHHPLPLQNKFSCYPLLEVTLEESIVLFISCIHSLLFIMHYSMAVLPTSYGGKTLRTSLKILLILRVMIED